MLIVGTYCFVTVGEVFTINDYLDYTLVHNTLKYFPQPELYDAPIRYAFLKIGYDIELVKLAPFLESIGVLFMTYLLAVQFSGKTGGLVAVTIVASSNLFRLFDTSAAYDNSWILLLLVAIYFANRQRVSFPSFVASILCKPLSIIFIPSMIFLSLKNKRLGLLYIGLGIIGLLFIEPIYDGFNQDEFISGLGDWWWFLFADLYMVVMVPVMIFLLAVFRKFALLTLMLNVIFAGAIVEGFTIINNEAYRYIPLMIFFAIGIGIFAEKVLKVNIQKSHKPV
jgi:hypothetical protein